MVEKKEQLLERYVKYLERLANAKSSEIFTNGGIEYASELMAVLFRNTEKDARIFCQGFKPDLITTQPYWDALKGYLENKEKTLKVLVECGDYSQAQPIRLLREKMQERNDDTIQLRIVSAEDRQKIYDGLDGTPCNFAIFDDNKFRFEYEPNGYRAFGSFNHPANARVLIDLFDEAFAKSNNLN